MVLQHRYVVFRYLGWWAVVQNFQLSCWVYAGIEIRGGFSKIIIHMDLTMLLLLLEQRLSIPIALPWILSDLQTLLRTLDFVWV